MRRDDEGFTLIELLLSIAILTVILATISTAMIVYLQNGTEALERDDHSGGAAVTTSYFDRDIASADAVLKSTDADYSSICPSSLSNVLVKLRWSDYTATSAAPSPSPLPATAALGAAYVVTTDTSSVPAGGGTRYKLERVRCLGTAETDRTILVRNLASSSTKATVTLSTSATDCTSGQALTLVLASYSADVSTPYTFRGCTKTRLTP